MEYKIKDKNIFTDKFIEAYAQALREDYRFFYDDFDEYGKKDVETAIYFIPGINGTPGQIRFIIPSILKNFGKDVFIKSCQLDEFAADKFIWDKYKLENLDKRKDCIVTDLNNLAKKHKRVLIFASSNGFYDFVHAYPDLSDELKQKIEVFWSAVAPDTFEPTVWEKVFSKINGFKIGEDQWFAFPNHNLLKFFNPETSMSHKWKHNHHKKIFQKADLEFRFNCFGFWWGYASIDRFNKVLNYLTRNHNKKIDVPVNFLIATSDGYWQGKSRGEIEKLLDKYCSNKKQIVYKKTSHLWVVVPNNLVNLDQ